MSSAHSRSNASEPSDALESAIDAAVQRIRAAIGDLAASNPVVLIDGRSGVGKTSLAARLVAQWPLRGPVQSVALDSIYPGWDGLREGSEYAYDRVLRPHARGLVGVWQRWNWETQRRAEAHAVDPALPLILEGVGALTPATARVGDVRVWVDAPDHSRTERALTRDGETFRPQWARWARQEDAHLRANRPRELATLVVVLP